MGRTTIGERVDHVCKRTSDGRNDVSYSGAEVQWYKRRTGKLRMARKAAENKNGQCGCALGTTTYKPGRYAGGTKANANG